MGSVHPPEGGTSSSAWNPKSCISRSYGSIDVPWKKNLAVFCTIFATVVTGGLALVPIGIGTWVHGAVLLQRDKKISELAQKALSGVVTPEITGEPPLQKKAKELFERAEQLVAKRREDKSVRVFGSDPTRVLLGVRTHWRNSPYVVSNLLKALKTYGESGDLNAKIDATYSVAQGGGVLSGSVRGTFLCAIDASEEESVVKTIETSERFDVVPEVVAFLREAVEFVKKIPDLKPTP
jgi:hypothetical protein